jgi:hypothetical protein
MPKPVKRNADSLELFDPYIAGYSPPKRFQTQPPSFIKKPHIIETSPLRGHMLEVFTSHHATRPNRDAFMPNVNKIFTTGNVTDNDNNDITEECKKYFADINIISCEILRGPDGTPLTDDKGYNRHCFVKRNNIEDIYTRKPKNMLDDLQKFTSKTKEIFDVTKNEYDNEYKAAARVKAERNPKDGKLVSADHYLLDDRAVHYMTSNHKAILDKNFVKNHWDVACAYFDPFRTDLPNNLEQYGFPTDKALIDVKPPNHADSPIDIADQEDFP